MTTTPPRWRKIPIETIQIIFSQGEKHLDAQLQSGIAADQRATTVATILIGVVTALFGATIVYWSAEHNVRILLSGLTTSFVMLVGAAHCLWSSRPVDFFYFGNQPNQWWEAADGNLNSLLGGETENYQQKIDDNAKVLNSNSALMQTGLLLAILAPVIGVLTWLLFSDLSYPADLFRAFCQLPV